MAGEKEIATLVAKLSLDSSNFETGIKKVSNPIKGFANGIQSISTVAAGVLTAGAFVGLVSGIKSIGTEAYNTVKEMQTMEMSITSLAASELVKQSGGMLDYADAIGQAGQMANETIDYIRKLAIVSPYDTATVTQAFQMNVAMGQSVKQAKKTTDAILKLGAGLGMTESEMSGFSVALAQTGATGKITAMDMRQFANNRFGLDKLSGVFEVLSKNMGVNIKTNEDFNKLVDSGKIKVEDFYDALAQYADKNYSGSVELMSGTLTGLTSTLRDIKWFALGDMFKSLGDSAAKALKPIVGYIGDFLGEGGFKNIGKKIEKWFQPAIDVINKLGKSMTNGTFTMALKNLQGWLKGSAEEGRKFGIAMEYIFGEQIGSKITNIVSKLNDIYQFFVKYKDYIITALKTIAEAFALLIVIKTVTDLVTALTSPIGMLIEVIGLLGIAWSNNFFGIQDIVKNFVAAVSPKLSGFVDDIEGWIDSAKKYVAEIRSVYDEQGLNGVINKIKEDVANIIPPEVMQSIENLCSSVLKYFETVKTGLERIIQQIKNLFKTPVKSLDQMAAEVGPFEYGKEPTEFTGIDISWTKIVSDAIDSMAKVFDIANIAVGTFFNGITGLFKWVNEHKEYFTGAFSAIGEGINEFIGYVGKVMDVIGEKGLVAGLEKVRQDLNNLLPPGLGDALAGIALVLGLVLAPVQTISIMLAAIADIAKNWGDNPLGLNKEDYDSISKSFESIKGHLSSIKESLSSIFGHGEETDPVKQLGEDATTHQNNISTLGRVLDGLAKALDAVMGSLDGFLKFLDDITGGDDLKEFNGLLGNGNVSLSPLVKQPNQAIGAIIEEFNRLNGYSIPVPDDTAYLQYFSHPYGVVADPVADLVRYIQDEMNKMGKTDYVTGPEDLKKQLLDIFQKLSQTLVGHSIVPDMVRDVNKEFEGWWEAIEPYIDNVVDGITEKFETLAQTLRDIVASITGVTAGGNGGLEGFQVEGPMPIGAAQPTPLQQTSAGGIFGQLFIPVPENVLSSYQSLSDKMALLVTNAQALNSALGGGGGIAGQGTGQTVSGGLLSLLTQIATYMSTTLTVAITDFGALISPQGTFGLAVVSLNLSLYSEGSNNALYQIYMLLVDYMTTTLTNAFLALDLLIRGTIMPTYTDFNYLIYYGDNTTYNALGAIQGVTQDINKLMMDQKTIIREELYPAYKFLSEKSGIAEGALQAIADAASGVNSQMTAAAMATWALIAALEALNSYDAPVGMNPRTTGGSSRAKEALAGGGRVTAGETYIVGERGAELFSPTRSGWIIPNEEAFGSGNKKVVNIEIHDIYGDANLEQRIKSGVQRGLEEAEFYGLGA